MTKRVGIQVVLCENCLQCKLQINHRPESCVAYRGSHKETAFLEDLVGRQNAIYDVRAS